MSSPDPRPIIFAPRAQIDIQDIFIRGLTIWSESQARSYDLSLRRAIRQLAIFPELGRTRDEVRPGCRSFPVGEHVVFYEIGADPTGGSTIGILRILHKNRHAADELQE